MLYITEHGNVFGLVVTLNDDVIDVLHLLSDVPILGTHVGAHLYVIRRSVMASITNVTGSPILVTVDPTSRVMSLVSHIAHRTGSSQKPDIHPNCSISSSFFQFGSLR